jgi:hypothetical protein
MIARLSHGGVGPSTPVVHPLHGAVRTTPPHDLIERFEIRARFPILEEGLGFEL